MKPAEELREQASILRGLARTIDSPKMREKLLAIAAQCERLALSKEGDAATAAMPPLAR